MSGTFPSTPAPSKLTVTASFGTLQDRTPSGRRNVRQLGAHLWELACVFPDTMGRDQFMPIMGFLMEQEGRFETFTFLAPGLAEPRGAATGTPLVNGATQTGKTLVTDGWAINTLQMRIGDIFKLTGSPKVYMVTQEATSDGSGNLTLNFRPGLIVSPADGENLVVTSVPFTVQLKEDRIAYDVSGPLLYQKTVEMIEAI